MTTMNQSILLLNQFLNLAGFKKYNQFQKNDFYKTGYNAYIDGCDEKLIEIQKQQPIIYKGITFNVRVTSSLLYETHELYMISMKCSKIHRDDHLIIEEYLSHLMIQFTSIINQNISSQLYMDDFIQSQFELAFLKLFNNKSNTSKNMYYLTHFICSPQLYFMEDNFYFKISPIKDWGIILELLLNIYQKGEFL
ncbi:MAG: hypothetical protein LUG60_07030 [Erysipelotrichaceae bacterium]|nr:hypothetical protein [Erysipelotrichaceae bacterium]